MTKYLFTHKILLVILLASVLRLAVLLLFPDVFAFQNTGAVQGSEAYDVYAQNLLTTGVYGRTPGEPDAAIPPLYSYALAIVYGLFGRGHIQVGLFHILLDGVSIWMLYQTAKRLFPMGEAVGLLAGVFYAFYPYLIFQNLTLIDTPLFMTFLYSFLLVMVLLRERTTLDRGTWALAVVGGVVLGSGMLTRPILPPLAVLVGLWFLFRRSIAQTFLRLLPVAVVSIGLLLPWVVRNYQLFDAFVMTTNAGGNFWQGNNAFTVPFFQAGYDVQWTDPRPYMQSEDVYGQEGDAEKMALGFQYWRENPEKLPELFWTKFLIHWSIEVAPRFNPNPGERLTVDENGEVVILRVDEEGELLVLGENDPVNAYDELLFDRIGRPIHIVYWGGLFLIGLAGMVLSLRYWREVSLLWFAQIAMTLVYLFFHPSTRYRVPTDPAWFVFSAYALVWAWGWWRASGEKDRTEVRSRKKSWKGVNWMNAKTQSTPTDRRRTPAA